LNSGKYAGKRLSRRQYRRGSDSSGSEDEAVQGGGRDDLDHSEESDDDDDDDNNDDDNDNDDDDGDGDGDEAPEEGPRSAGGSDASRAIARALEADRSTGERGGDSSGGDSAGSSDDEGSEGEDGGVQILPAGAVASDPVSKGKHVATQKQMWDSFLQLRMRLQTALDAASRTPLPHVRAAAAAAAGRGAKRGAAALGQLEAGFVGCGEAVAGLLGELLGLQTALIDATPATTQACGPAAKRQRGGDGGESGALWAEVEGQQERLRPYFRGTLDKWGKRTQVKKTPFWSRSWANSSLAYLCSHRDVRANLHLFGITPNTFQFSCCRRARGWWPASPSRRSTSPSPRR
jgi:hypothetical protein